MIKEIMFLIIALALLILFFMIFNFLFKILAKYDDKYIEKRKKEEKEYFTKQKNMQYNEWKNPYNTSAKNNVFPECLKALGFSDWPKDMETIKNQYRTLAKEKHPDMVGGSSEAFEKINKAYQEAQSLERYKS